MTEDEWNWIECGTAEELLKRAEGEFAYLKTRAGFVLAGMEGVRYRVGELTLSHGDRIFLYTDGVTEATNAETQMYGEDRLLYYLNRNADTDAAALLPALKSDIDAFVGEAPQFDDITMLMFDYRPTASDVQTTGQTEPSGCTEG